MAVAALHFLLLTGLRKGQALQARWTDLDLTQGTLRLPPTPSGRARTAVLSPAAITLLEQQHRLAGNPFVFPGRERGRPLKNPDKAFHRLLATAGLTDLRIGDLSRGAARPGRPSFSSNRSETP